MESEEISEIVEFQKTTEFLTAEDLVALRKPNEEPSFASIGIKFPTRTDSLMEDEAVETALKIYRDSLSQKRGARICDFIQATWNEDLHVVVTSKLKGKFVQHMGHTIDGGIALSPEEALFLLENGCIEIINGKTPMSTEEAYAVMLERHLSMEKYQVYSHLSQLGFLVVPHQKELNSKTQVKITNSEKTEKRKRKSSPLPEEQSPKRLTFSGAFSEENSDFKTSSAVVDSESAVESNMVISVDEENHTSQPAEENISDNQLGESELCMEEVIENDKTTTEPCNDFQTIESYACAESPATDPVECKAIDLSAENFIEEMDVDSHSTDNSFHVSEKFVEVQDEEKETESNNEAVVPSEDSQCAVIGSSEKGNKENSNFFSYPSDSENNTEEDNWLTNLGEDGMDDEVTLLEITKKETTPLAVIDLLSDEEQDNKSENDLSESDDDIKIIEVCEGPLNKEKLTEPLNLEKIKSKKIQNWKSEEATQTPPITLAPPPVQFPDIFRKELVCVARPPLNLLPFRVLPKKEVYILDLAKHNQQSGQASQQPRLWNSYRDMQDYQRARRQNRHFRPHSYHQNQEGKSWHHRNFDHHNGSSSRDHRQVFNRDYSSMRVPEMNPWSRHDRAPSRNSWVNTDSVPREQQNELDLSEATTSQDQKPFKQTVPPLIFGNSSEPSSFRLPQFPSNSLVSSTIRPHGMNFGFENHSINTMNSFASSSVPHYPNFLAEVHRTAYSYATSMLTSMFGPSFSPNVPRFLPPQPEMSNQAFNMMPPFNGSPSFNSNSLPVPNNEHFSLPNGRPHFSDYRRHQRGNAFPCRYRNVDNKKSWEDVSTTIDRASDDDTSDIEEIPINLNEFLWNPNSICPLVQPGVKHNISDVLKPLRLTQMAKLTDKNNKNLKYFLGSSTLEITFDVYLPGTNFKKSCPGVPKHRVIVVRSSDSIPRYSEIAVLQRKWGDGAILQIAVVDDNHISFCSFNSVSLPDLVPFEE